MEILFFLFNFVSFCTKDHPHTTKNSTIPNSRALNEDYHQHNSKGRGRGGVSIHQEWHQGRGITPSEVQEHEEKHQEVQSHQKEDHQQHNKKGEGGLFH
jgi:hypothetical protein